MRIKIHYDQCDAAENAFFSRELEARRREAFEVEFAENKGSSFLYVDTNFDPGAEEYSFQVFESYGKAELAASLTRRGPRADVKGTEALATKFRSLTSSYGISIQEMRAARMARRPLEPMKAQAARRAIADQWDDIILIGDGTATYLGLTGMFKFSGTSTYTVPVGAGGETEFEEKTPDEIVFDLSSMVTKIITNTKERIAPDTLLLPVSTDRYISTVRMGDAANFSIKQQFLNQNPQIKRIDTSLKLETAGSGSSKRAVCYKNSEDVLCAPTPIIFEQFAPQQEAFEVLTDCHARTGGAFAFKPLGICYADTI